MSKKKIRDRAQHVAVRRFSDLFAEAAEALVNQHDEASGILATASCVLCGYEYDEGDENESADGVDLARFIIAGIEAELS